MRTDNGRVNMSSLCLHGVENDVDIYAVYFVNIGCTVEDFSVWTWNSTVVGPSSHSHTRTHTYIYIYIIIYRYVYDFVPVADDHRDRVFLYLLFYIFIILVCLIRSPVLEKPTYRPRGTRPSALLSFPRGSITSIFFVVIIVIRARLKKKKSPGR